MTTLDQAIEQMRSAGMPEFPPGHPRLNTDRVVRYGPKRAAWYRLYEHLGRTGKSYISGAYGQWGVPGLEGLKVESDWTGMDAEERAAALRAQREVEEREARKREQRATFAANRAAQQWASAEAIDGPWPYLERKQVTAEAVRCFADGTLLVPMRVLSDAGDQLVGLQKIAPDGTKRFTKGMAKAGACCRLGVLQPFDAVQLVMIGEGYATSRSVRMAVADQSPVYVGFDAYNLLHVARAVRQRYPRAHILMLADDDYATAGNPGLTKAQQAADAVGAAEGLASIVCPLFAARGENKWTDFNDLHAAEGLQAVRDQVLAAIVAAMAMAGAKVPDAAASQDNPPPPPENGEARATGGKGRRKRSEKPVDWDRYNDLLERFVLIYGTDTVFDCAERMVLKVNALRLAYGNDYVKMWLAAEKRRMILPDQLVFDPGGQADEECINLFVGLPVDPDASSECQPMLELLGHLCGESAVSEGGIDAVMDWVLDWLAYPLQHPGAKMASALVFHGPQGAGKNLFFEAVASLYGRYALVVGQDQLEDRFNDWASQKLFLIGDEVVARAELYHQKNKLKAFITGETIQINTKMLPLRTEANHVNVVFLSNEHQPLALERGDRRFLVVYTPPMRDDDLYARVAEFLRAGGARRFLRYLLDRQLGDFTRHTRPIMTRAKADLIELGLKPPERFVREWFKGYLPLPLQVCAAEQLYRAFRRWCHLTGERFPPSQIGFTKGVEKAVGDRLRYKIIKLDSPDRGKTSARMWLPAGCAPPETMTEGRWAAEAVDQFEHAVADFLGAREESHA